MNHVVELSDFVIRIGDDRKVEGCSLCLTNVLSPALVRISRVHAQSDHFHVALIKFRFQPRSFAQFSRADRSEVFGVGKQNCPTVAKPLMKTDWPFGGFSVKVW